MLLVCFAILATLLPRQSPAIPFCGFMSSELWVVSREEIPAARLWICGIFLVYLAIGITGWLRGSRIHCGAVPFAITLSCLLAYVRFAIGMKGFSQ